MRLRWSIFSGAILSFIASAAMAGQVFLTSGTTTWTVPDDWNSQDNKVEVIAAGGEGGITCGGTITTIGGGGGGYSAITNLALTPGSVVNVHIAKNGDGSGTRETAWFVNSSTVLAQNGYNGQSCAGNAGQGGQAASGVGTTKFSGGNGGNGSGGGSGVASGGGAAGPHGNGASSGLDTGIGGDADAGFGGVGGVCLSMSCTPASGNGGDGTEFNASHGAGGGGAANNSTFGLGGNYGGGNAAFGGGGVSPSNGLIVITWTPHRRISSGVF